MRELHGSQQASNGTAASDYNATRGSSAFRRGEARQTFAPWIRSDREREAAGTFTYRSLTPPGQLSRTP